MEEITWRPVKGYKNLYEVADNGIVRSAQTKKFLKPFDNGNGYNKVILYRNNGERTAYYVHRLVGKAFIENPFQRKQVNHLDGMKKNNRVSNLEWVTPKQNFKHAKDTGLLDRSRVELTKAQRLGVSIVLALNPLASVESIVAITGASKRLIEKTLKRLRVENNLTKEHVEIINIKETVSTGNE